MKNQIIVLVASAVAAFVTTFGLTYMLTRPEPARTTPPVCLLDTESTAEDMADLILKLEEESLFDVLGEVVPVLTRRYNLDMEI